jgi:hypothetical protein
MEFYCKTLMFTSISEILLQRTICSLLVCTSTVKLGSRPCSRKIAGQYKRQGYTRILISFLPVLVFWFLYFFISQSRRLCVSLR